MMHRWSVALCGAVLLASPAQGAGSEIHVSPSGDDRATGTAQRPFRTLERAQREVRARNQGADVTVLLHDGTYPLPKPLRFDPKDGGQGRAHVTWRAAADARPVISGGQVVTGWRLTDKAENIWSADIPKDVDTRQLFMDGVMLQRATVSIHRDEIAFDQDGFTLKGKIAEILTGVSADRLELHVMALWSSRNIPAREIRGGRVLLQQPGWYNSYTNNDTVNKGHAPGDDRINLVGPCAFLKVRSWLGSSDQWCIEPKQGRIYIKAGYKTDPSKSQIVMPRLGTLLSISGDASGPIRNLSFTGIRFSHTSWMGPSSADGYANIQTGVFISGAPVGALAPYGSCFSGCRSFEAKRELWNSIPAAVQISRAENISLKNNIFSQLGQVALGIGNDGDANLSGFDLGAKNIAVEGNHFAMLAGGAIIGGGLRADAHHPSNDALRNSNLVIRNNVITDIGRDYRDNAGIFISYFDGVTIQHNDISDTPYSPIAVGWGWGHNDVGGTHGLAEERGRYEYQPRYTEPTIMRNVIIANNRLTDVTRDFLDGGGIYTLSSIPGTVIRENYLQGVGGNALYVDQGSRHIRFERNVVDTQGYWLHGNNGSPVTETTPGAIWDPRGSGEWTSPRTTDNVAIGNWHNAIRVRGDWIPELRNIVRDNVLVADKIWPAEAQRIIAKAGATMSTDGSAAR
ncbi:right-handed parallel beta-helix repeat-containing protein [Sphingobium algorifonticola]|uniref:Right-handed parallel beta-helix repeat-containing protein n=1 Tax=Sphingobium algorifonticola TaxID=2008318 RepID=A0A437J4F1_9SPHN|nr:right-handed parallel beta-helix repeat-containing protein [Sphingobium algorifonticola]